MQEHRTLIFDLPRNVLKHIFMLDMAHDPDHVAHMMLVCKAWKEAATDPDLWKDVTIQLDTHKPATRLPSYARRAYLSRQCATSFRDWLVALNTVFSATGQTVTLPNITNLTIRGTELPVAAMDMMPIVLPSLQVFDVTGCFTRNPQCSNPPLSLAAVGKSVTNLVSLNLTSTRVRDAGLQHLTALSHLAELIIKNANIGDEGVGYLAQLTHVTKLDISGAHMCCVNKPFCITASALQRLSSLACLKSLGLGLPPWIDEEVLECTNLDFLSCLSNLQQLDISHHAVNRNSVEQLTTAMSITNLVMSRCRWESSDCLQPLGNLTNLHALEVQRWYRSCAAIVDVHGLTELTLLHLKDGVALTNGLGALAGARKLHTLDVGFLAVDNINALSTVTTSKALTLRDVHVPSVRVLASLTQLTELRLIWEKDYVRTADLDGLPCLVNLHVLEVRQHNCFTTAAMQHLSTLPLLEDLNLAGSAIERGAVRHLSSLTNLTQLQLDASLEGVDFPHLSNLRSIQRLNTGFNTKLSAAFFQALTTMTGLRALSIRSLPAGNEVVQYLTKLTALREFSMVNCNAYREDEEVVVNFLSNKLKSAWI